MGFLARFESQPRAEITTPRSPATWFLEAMFGQREASSGIRVSEATALSLSAYYCGINMISGTLGSLPLNVYKSDGVRRDVWPQHPAHRLLHTEPNPEMTAMSLRQSWVMHAIARGNAYGEILWDSRGNPMEIWPLLPTLTRPVRDDQMQLWYEVRPWQKEVRYLKPENVLHVPGLGYDGVCGYGLIRVARESIGLNAAQDRYAGKFFRNGGTVSGVLESPGTLSAPQFERLKSEVATKLQGLDNAHRIAILEAGIKFNSINPNHKDAQLIEARRFTVEEWARWLNIPVHKLKELTHATFSNIEHQNIEWAVDTIRPWAVRFEQEFNRKLFRKQGLFYTKHVLDGLLRGDQKARFESYAISRTWGWMSANDVLELEDRNPLPGKIGEMYLVPLNMTPAELAGKQKVQTSTPPAPGAPGDPGPEDPAQPVPAPTDPGQARQQARAGARRVVHLESRLLQSRRSDTYFEVRSSMCEWLGVTSELAGRYCGLAQQLNLIAEEQSIAPAELQARKIEALEKLVLSGGNDAAAA